MKRLILPTLGAVLFSAGLAIGAANSFNPSGTFGQTYAVLYDMTGVQLGTNANPLITTCQ